MFLKASVCLLLSLLVLGACGPSPFFSSPFRSGTSTKSNAEVYSNDEPSLQVPISETADESNPFLGNPTSTSKFYNVHGRFLVDDGGTGDDPAVAAETHHTLANTPMSIERFISMRCVTNSIAKSTKATLTARVEYVGEPEKGISAKILEDELQIPCAGLVEIKIQHINLKQNFNFTLIQNLPSKRRLKTSHTIDITDESGHYESVIPVQFDWKPLEE